MYIYIYIYIYKVLSGYGTKYDRAGISSMIRVLDPSCAKPHSEYTSFSMARHAFSSSAMRGAHQSACNAACA